MLNTYEIKHMSAEDCWNQYGWGSEAKANSDVLHFYMNDYDVFCDELVDEYNECQSGKPAYACEIYHGIIYDGDLVGQGFGDSYENAFLDAVISVRGNDAMNENDNCEDAVNVAAYYGYCVAYGEDSARSWYMFADSASNMDKLLGAARKFVKENIRFVDYEWEEY